MVRKVLLPREIDNRLNDLTHLVEEVDGILLYRRRVDDTSPVEDIFMTGVGTEGHVQSQPERMEVANEFFRQNPDYQFIKFHTHSRGTIARFGRYYAWHFSQEDLEGIQEQLQYDRAYMAMLVTPEAKLLHSIDNAELHIVSDFPGYAQRSRAVDQAVKVIAQNLGYDLSTLRARQT